MISCLCVQDMDQQLSDARMRIVQLTTEVQSSKQAAQHHEERTAALQAQVHVTWSLDFTLPADNKCMYLASQQNLLVSHELAVLVAKSAWIPSHTLSNKAGQEDACLPTGLLAFQLL